MVNSDAVEWYNKGVHYSRKGDHNLAIWCYDRATSIDPEYAKAWYNKGIAYKKKRMYDKAKDCFKKALDADPNYEKAEKILSNFEI